MFRLVRYYPESHPATHPQLGERALLAPRVPAKLSFWNIILSFLPEESHSADFYRFLSFYFILFAFSYNFIA